MKLVIFHLKHLIRHPPRHLCGLYSRIMRSIPVHVRSIGWTGGGCLVIVGHRGEGELQIGSQLVPFTPWGPITDPFLPWGGSINPKFSATARLMENVVKALVWAAFRNSFSGTACKIRASYFQVMVGIQFFFTVTWDRSSRSCVQAYFCSYMSCCMLLLCTSCITRFQNRLPDVTGCLELMISSNFTWYSLVLKLTRRYSPVIYFRVKNVMLNGVTIV